MTTHRKYTEIYVGDFETTVYPGQKSTEVWASALVKVGTEEVHIFHSIGETFDWLKSLKQNVIVYYHNLAFDGNFWMYYLLHDVGYQQALSDDGSDFEKASKMKDKQVSYVISAEGNWYSMSVKVGQWVIQFRDSLKLIPLSVKAIGKAFHTKHKKLNMEYTGLRFAGCEISQEEQEYIANDVLVVKEALEMMFAEGHDKLTIGSCCMSEFRALTGDFMWGAYFPDLTQINLPEEYGSRTVDEYIRRSYRGGWCYVVPEKTNKIYHHGTVADVNSLYPSMMLSESGNRYPIGTPRFWKGDYIPAEAQAVDRYFFIRIKTRFYIKRNRLPFLQIKRSWLYRGNDMLTTSDVRNQNDGRYYASYYDLTGKLSDTRQTMTLTCTDYKLLQEQYRLVDFEILDGCWFFTEEGLFDAYLNKYRKMKMESTGGRRQIAKLLQNNLYGKLAASDDSSYKQAYLEDGVLKYKTVEQHKKKPGYIPCGSAITSYARNFTIRAAQANYHGPDRPGFIYADTDSIHCDLKPGELKGIKVDDVKYNCWKLESCWDSAVFVRQKTYIEHVTGENLKPIDLPYWNVKCAGMPESCKKRYLAEHAGRELEDFHAGLVVQGKLRPVHIPGGVLLTETPYEMRG